ncbi:ABC transporter ATP-binding protein [Thermococcus sp.]|uniref:ABC transporter ATP-binding protein n=1 Tax=Thermococcus sp. TaxID=35749 RepID=UPI0026107FC2|nr:ABC transporter ATP-binding protein [Thermococcus sp.]
MLEVINVSAGYGRGDVIHDISFTAVRGEIYLLLGTNGAGKTTTFRVVTGILPLSSGRVVIEGVDLWKEPTKAKVMIGYLPEGERVYPNLSVYKNLLFFSRIYGVPEGRINKILKEFGLYEHRDKKAGELSRGLRKRLALARALLHDPEVLVLDEPFSNLDVPSVMELRERIIEMLKEEKIVLFSTHILSELQHFEGVNCRVGIIRDGKLILEEKLENLISLLRSVEVVLTVTNQELALRVLKEKEYNTRAEGRNIVVSVSSYASEVPEITSVLAENGVGLLQVRPKEVPLEKLFMELSRGNEAHRR